uniref:Uncharacterized protein n=1 Tax=viral metagenome TaxID=1070528 RepID=A0A6M3IDC5_9ZZZZ
MANAIVYAPDLYTKPPVTSIGGAMRDFRRMTVTAAQLITTNIFALGILPANHRLTDLQLEVPDLEASGGTTTVTVGILNNYYNTPDASTDDPGFNENAGVIGIPAQTGSDAGATTPAEADGDGGTTPVLSDGLDILNDNTVARAGGRAGPDTDLTPTTTIGKSLKDRIIGVQFPVIGTMQAGTIAISYEVDQN